MFRLSRWENLRTCQEKFDQEAKDRMVRLVGECPIVCVRGVFLYRLSTSRGRNRGRILSVGLCGRVCFRA
ncbi:hypothetical protein BU169_11150 [Corynebacterium diphtheriae]|nr:hypothetical protein BU169_11150 [Corynebacterium diphtheriae]